ncbi:MAG: hypothetical protein JSW39_16170, partial [Desulfobacterales bacterium]
MQALVTLTSEESRRLVAKAVARLEAVRQAQKSGLIGFCLCTSCGYIIQEILGTAAVDPGGYCCGFIHGQGSCSVPDQKREKLLLLEKGQPRWLDFPHENFTEFLDRMDAEDVIIKSGNLMDPHGNVGVLVASPDGGEAGAYLPRIAARGIQLIVPMTLNKTVPLPLKEILPYMGIAKFRRDRVHGLSCGMLALPGRVVTEIDALQDLFGVRALPAAMDGVGSGTGTVTLVLAGAEKFVETAWRAV